jgi:hypothetical protein
MVDAATMYDMTYNTTRFHLGTADFRQKVSDEKLRLLVQENEVVEVGRYAHEAAAIVVAPALFAALTESSERFEAMKTTLPLLLAAVRSGIGIPSETLAQMGISHGDQSWQALNEFQAAFPVHFNINEDGTPITRGRLTPQAFIPEADFELEPLDD